MSFLRTHVLAPAADPATYRALAFLVSALPLGVAWIVMLAVGWSLGAGLLITLIGLPLLLGLAYAARFAAGVERILARGLLGVRLADPARRVWQGSILGSLRTWIGDAGAWREQVYLVARAVLGGVLGLVALAFVGQGGYLLTAPLHFFAGGGIELGALHIDTFGESLLGVMLGTALLAVSPALVRVEARLWVPVARALLDGREAPARLRLAGSPSMRRALAIHAGAWLVLNLVMVVIWTGTTPGGYFWPVWTMLPLALLLGLHAAAVGPSILGPGLGPRLRGLVIHAGVVAAIFLFLTCVWLVTTPGGRFWPGWAMLGLVITLAIHGLVVVASGGDRAAMAERIDELTVSRAGAVDAQAAELRRIERDLHDGAQARLVALAMDLGMARDKAAGLSPEVRTLVEGAHEDAKRAIAELRDLARGIHPAVLTDRGLPAALGSLTGASAIPVELDVDVEGRLPAALEAAAYFVVGESLANAAKHSGADAVQVQVRRRDGLLSVRVRDDGRGGADITGGGLDGLRCRVEAHDGRLRVDSPPGGGTTVVAEMPCGS